ncbi:MAG TPA: hypothetical protein VFP05_04720 [Thermomicrobiales bacterium]|nr:hypothetical protein [Thermomicrobiales bacterium]
MGRRHRQTGPCRVFDATFVSLELDLLERLVASDVPPSRIHPNDGLGQGLTPCERIARHHGRERGSVRNDDHETNPENRDEGYSP